jgi:hypothetical protein
MLCDSSRASIATKISRCHLRALLTKVVLFFTRRTTASEFADCANIIGRSSTTCLRDVISKTRCLRAYPKQSATVTVGSVLRWRVPVHEDTRKTSCLPELMNRPLVSSRSRLILYQPTRWRGYMSTHCEINIRTHKACTLYYILYSVFDQNRTKQLFLHDHSSALVSDILQLIYLLDWLLNWKNVY